VGIARSRLLAGMAALCALGAGRRPAEAMPEAGPRVGEPAPEFSGAAVQRGVISTFDLRRAAAADGTLMLYFFVKAFTPA